jgi:hypothetical protein
MEETNIITLTGENDEQFEFEIADSFELEGNKYIALIPPEDEEAEEDEVLIMRIESEEEDETILTQIEDDDELDRAFEMFRDRCAELFDFAD